MSKRKSSISASVLSEVTMNLVEYDGDLSKLNGELLAGWFIANPNGPTAFALGFVEYENSRRMFYKPLLPAEISEAYVRNYMKL